jgi:hypothetical protein
MVLLVMVLLQSDVALETTVAGSGSVEVGDGTGSWTLFSSFSSWAIRDKRAIFCIDASVTADGGGALHTRR